MDGRRGKAVDYEVYKLKILRLGSYRDTRPIKTSYIKENNKKWYYIDHHRELHVNTSISASMWRCLINRYSVHYFKSTCTENSDFPAPKPTRPPIFNFLSFFFFSHVTSYRGTLHRRKPLSAMISPGNALPLDWRIKKKNFYTCFSQHLFPHCTIYLPTPPHHPFHVSSETDNTSFARQSEGSRHVLIKVFPFSSRFI